MRRSALMFIVGCCLIFLSAGCGNKIAAVISAIESGDDAGVQRLLDANPELVKQKCDKDETLLHIAVECNDQDIAKTLITAGSDVNAKDASGKTPLNVALSKGKEEGCEIAQLLIERGADVKIAVDADPECKSVAESVEKIIADAKAAAKAREERIARENEERAHRERARQEAEAIWNSLEVTQGIGTYNYLAGYGTTTTARPGDSISFGVSVRNKDRSPVSGIKCVLERNKYIEVGRYDERVPLLRKTYQRKLTLWETTGIPVIRRKHNEDTSITVVDTVNPYGDPHYEENTKRIDAGTNMAPYTKEEDTACDKAESAAGIVFTMTPGNYTGAGSLPLKLSKSAPAGTDIPVQLYIVIKGHRFPLPPMTIQVKHTE